MRADYGESLCCGREERTRLHPSVAASNFGYFGAASRGRPLIVMELQLSGHTAGGTSSEQQTPFQSGRFVVDMLGAIARACSVSLSCAERQRVLLVGRWRLVRLENAPND